MMRTDARLAALLTTALLTACDPGNAEFDEPAEQVVSDEAPAPTVDTPDALAAQPDWSLEQECESYYFATRQNKSYKTQCVVDTPEPQLPVIFPDWDDLFGDELDAAASATCTGLGARNGNGELPAGPMQQMGIGVNALAAAGGQAPAGGQQLGAAPPVCESVCQSHGKIWNPNAANYGTCAFNLAMQIQPPQHANAGPVCPGPDITAWDSEGSVLFDCGCVCVSN